MKMHLYDSTIPSGNAYKVHLLLSHLDIPYDNTSLDIFADPPENRTAEFLALNPTGQIPVLILDTGTPLAESSAILFYLAEGSKYLSDTKYGRAKVLQWLFFEQQSHEPYLGVYKSCTYWQGFASRSRQEIDKLKLRGQIALDVMEKHLQGKRWFVDETFTIADVALYPHTSTAEILGFKVGENVKAWLSRVEGLEGHVRIKKDPTGKCPL